MKISISQPTDKELDDNGLLNCAIWECEPSTFDWTYTDKETCYLLTGEVTVKTDTETVSFGAGDMVVFPAGLACEWQVKQKVKKHYRFG